MVAFSGYAYGGDGNVYTKAVTDDSWNEGAITWNNQPSASVSNYGHWWLWYNSTPGIQTGVNSSDELAGLVQIESDGDHVLSLRLSSPGYSTNYYSREWTEPTELPVLQVFYIEP